MPMTRWSSLTRQKLPGTVELVSLRTAQEIWDAIYLLRVRGAPAIGVTAAFGMYVLAKGMPMDDFDSFYREFVQRGLPGFLPAHGGKPFLGVKTHGRRGACFP